MIKHWEKKENGTQQDKPKIFDYADFEKEAITALKSGQALTSKDGYRLEMFERLDDWVYFTCESGFFIGNDSGGGHLASNLRIPALIIGARKKLLNRWRPDWLKSEIIIPRRYLPLPTKIKRRFPRASPGFLPLQLQSELTWILLSLMLYILLYCDLINANAANEVPWRPNNILLPVHLA